MNGPTLHVDLGVLTENLLVVHERVAPAGHMLVVKDDAYGHGLEPVVRTATAAGLGWFGTFDVATALRVRQVSGSAARAFAFLADTPDEIRAALDGGVEVGVGSAAALEDAATVAASTGERVDVHLKVDTGLHRNGVRDEEWASFAARAAELAGGGRIRIRGVWSHLAEASDAEDDRARATFDRACAILSDLGVTGVLRHLAASAAGFARPGFRYDLTRIGAFAYGIRPVDGPGEGALGVNPVARLSAPVVGVAADGVRVAVGALHGLPSSLAGRTSVGTPGGRQRLISVDLCTSTVAHWPGASPGQEVTVFGDPRGGAPSASDQAAAIGTIGEEILLRVNPLVPRMYVR